MKLAVTRKHHRPEEVVAKLRAADEALSQGKTLPQRLKAISAPNLSIPEK